MECLKPMTIHETFNGALVIGGGPAGLMAADALLSLGVPVLLTDHKPSLARKFLMAGKSGLNLTKMEPFEAFLAAYGPSGDWLRPMLSDFGPEQVRAWAEGLGQPCFTGSTARLFPEAMKASPLLRAWLSRLTDMGLEVRTRWRWTGREDGFVFETPEGPVHLAPKVTVLALGGASWARLGSDGEWRDAFSRSGIPLEPFAASNAGLCVDWSAHMAQNFGKPLKNIAFHAGQLSHRGEAVISARGLEGGGIYPLSPALRAGESLTVDLLPDLTVGEIGARLARPKGKQSLSNHLRKALKWPAVSQALLMEMARPLPGDPQDLARLIKALPLHHAGLRPIDEAISTVGGVPEAAVNGGLMLREWPGVFCAGEMLDWDAPTGGYLLTACFATGLWAGRHAAEYLQPQGA
jgi:uncharacterized flavoprotein (TIGR03862 family)